MEPSFYSQNDLLRQGTMLANRAKKNYRHRVKHFKRQNVNAFRLYHWDIPEIRAVVDWYDGHLVVGEYVRTQTEGTPWLETVSQHVAEALDVPQEKVFLKRRRTRPGTFNRRYEKLANSNELVTVKEHDLKFYVNLKDYLDTGLFMDHRQTRQMIRAMATGKNVLNLFGYTGAFTVYAAAGGATQTCTVDLSGKYLGWAEKNIQLNDLMNDRHRLVEMDVLEFLDQATRDQKLWDLIILDPPSFSTRRDGFEFDILRDHPSLIRKALGVLNSGGQLLFSSNHRDFEPRFHDLPCDSQELTHKNMPLDFKNNPVHRSFLLSKKGK